MGEVPNSMCMVEESREKLWQDFPTEELKKHVLDGLRRVADKRPINNAGSYPLTLLWQIFKEAEWSEFDSRKLREINKIDDGIWEAIFEDAFPVFFKGYPEVLVLDR